MKTSYKITLGSVLAVAITASVLAATGAISASSTILLGNTTVEPWGYSLSAGTPESFKVKANQSGTIGAFHVYLGELNTATSVNIGLYTNSNNSAGSLISSGTIVSPAKSKWNEISVKSSIKIESGSYYWLAILGTGGTLRYRDARQPCQTETSSQIGLISLPQNWAKGIVYPECNISAYITLGEERTETLTAPTIPVETTTTPVAPNTGCFENPESEGTARITNCGYPTPENAGAEVDGVKCSSLPIYTGGNPVAKAKIEGQRITKTLTIQSNEVTLNHDCIEYNGNTGSAWAIRQESGTGLVIENTTIRGLSKKEGIEKSIWHTGGSRPLLKKDVLENCGECITGEAEVVESYINANEEHNGLHRETWYQNEETSIAKHDTFFVPESAVAIIFANTNNGVGGTPCETHITVENSLLAGSGQMIQQCGSRSKPGNATLTFKNNRIAKCLTTPIKENNSGLDNCSGPYIEGSDSHGYMPNGGAIGVQTDRTNGPTGANYVWEGNYWDNNLEAVAAPAP